MIKPKHPELSLSRQCSLLGISRSSVYYNQSPVKAEDVELMNIIDKQYLKTPFYGSRSMTKHLKREGYDVNRKRIQRLMRLMGLEAVYPRPRTSIPYSGHTVYPYLLRGMSIERPNQVWAADITYIPLNRGFMYLVAIMDWNSRKVLAWRVSNTMESGFCVEALQEAMDRYGCPEIFNTDQGSQFTSQTFTGLLQENGIKISMDGRGRFHDNIFIERLWWTVKYQYLYLRTFDNGTELREGLKKWFSFYNGERPHQSLNDLTPDEVYCKNLNPVREAA
jgi:putative transposase